MLLVVTEVYRQQLSMYEKKEQSIENRIVSLTQPPEGVTTELGGRADNGLRPYPSPIKVAFMGGQIG
jgi:hypothetical protein